VAVALEQPTPVDLGQAPQALRLEQLDRPMELGEVLLDQGVASGRSGRVSDRSSSTTERSPLTNPYSRTYVRGYCLCQNLSVRFVTIRGKSSKVPAIAHPQ
jgi:hypothetical protein